MKYITAALHFLISSSMVSLEIHNNIDKLKQNNRAYIIGPSEMQHNTDAIFTCLGEVNCGFTWHIANDHGVSGQYEFTPNVSYPGKGSSKKIRQI